MSDPVSERTVFVAAGQATDVRVVGKEWRKGDGFLECSGENNYLYGGKGLGEGDVRIRIRLTLSAVDRSAASLQIDGGHFGFDGAHGSMFVSGGLFGGLQSVGQYGDYLTPGNPFDLEVVRTGGRISFAIDGKRVYEQADPRAVFGTVGLRPWRATMRVHQFEAEGQPIEARPRPDRLPFAVPVIDISGQRERHVVIAHGTPTEYWGHPTTLLMPNGTTLFCVYPRGHGGPDAVLRRSDDGGLTWAPPVPTPDSWRESNNCPALFRFVGPDGVERLFVFEGNGEMRQAMSVDGGATWSEMVKNGLRTVMPFTTIIRLTDGRLMGGWNVRRETHISFSADGGLTWSPQRRAAGETESYPGAWPCEPAFVRSPDGRQIAMLMRENSRRYCSMVMFTEDEGETWSEMRELPREISGDRHQPRYAADGRLVIPFRDTAPQTPAGCHFVAWVGTYDDIRLGRPGQCRIKLLHSYGGGDQGYPGNELLPDGTFVITTYIKYNPGPEKQSVVSVRFRLAEIDAALAEAAPE